MTNEGAPKDDVQLPPGDLGKQIQAAFDDGKDLLVTVIFSMDEEQVCVPNLPPHPLLIDFVQ